MAKKKDNTIWLVVGVIAVLVLVVGGGFSLFGGNKISQPSSIQGYDDIQELQDLGNFVGECDWNSDRTIIACPSLSYQSNNPSSLKDKLFIQDIPNSKFVNFDSCTSLIEGIKQADVNYFKFENELSPISGSKVYSFSTISNQISYGFCTRNNIFLIESNNLRVLSNYKNLFEE